MVTRIERDHINRYGGEDAFMNRVREYWAELKKHAQTVGKPGPTTDPLVMQVALSDGVIEVFDLPEHPQNVINRRERLRAEETLKRQRSKKGARRA